MCGCDWGHVSAQCVYSNESSMKPLGLEQVYEAPGFGPLRERWKKGKMVHMCACYGMSMPHALSHASVCGRARTCTARTPNRLVTACEFL